MPLCPYPFLSPPLSSPSLFMPTLLLKSWILPLKVPIIDQSMSVEHKKLFIGRKNLVNPLISDGALPIMDKLPGSNTSYRTKTYLIIKPSKTFRPKTILRLVIYFIFSTGDIKPF
jgi:hypothetical protein